MLNKLKICKQSKYLDPLLKYFNPVQNVRDVASKVKFTYKSSYLNPVLTRMKICMKISFKILGESVVSLISTFLWLLILLDAIVLET